MRIVTTATYVNALLTGPRVPAVLRYSILAYTVPIDTSWSRIIGRSTSPFMKRSGRKITSTLRRSKFERKREKLCGGISGREPI